MMGKRAQRLDWQYVSLIILLSCFVGSIMGSSIKAIQLQELNPQLYLMILLEVVSVITTLLFIWATVNEGRTDRQTILEATELQITASVSPYLHFRIRPRSHYDDPNIEYSRRSWVRGVGIYVENIGPGPAANVMISCEVIQKDGLIRCYEEKFIGSRLLPNNVWTFPSKDWDLKIKKSDDKIIINTEYNDRLNKLRSQESFELDIEDRHFLEYQVAPLKVGDVDELEPEEKFSVDVEYYISTESDWTSFSIDSEEKWEDQNIEILSGKERLLYPPKINSKEIYLAKKSYDDTYVKIRLNAKIIIPKSKRGQNVVYVIKKGDIKSTTVDIMSEDRKVDVLTNDGNIARDPENYKEWYVSVEKHLKR